MTEFFMMIGLPASGKSTEAKKLAEKYNAKIFSSDEYRNKYADGETDQTKNQIIFNKLREDLFAEIRKGNNVVFDATNVSLKDRRSWLNSLPKEVIKHAYLIATPYEICLENNKKRDRVVPDYAITRMYKRFDTPSIEEGFNDITVIYYENSECSIEATDIFKIADNMNHDNHHHTLTIGKHMKKAYALFREKYPDEDNLLYAAILLHDMGKPFCKVFKDAKFNDTTEAHYYGHEHVGAYDALFFDYGYPIRLNLSWLINHHMDPFNFTTNKAINKWLSKWGTENYNLIMKIHEADLMAK